MAERYDPSKDPITGAGPTSGTHRTRSGRLVTANGLYLTPAETQGADKVRPGGADVIRSKPEDIGPGIRIPGVPHVFSNRDSLVKFLQNSPGYVKKQRGWLNAHHQEAMKDAGFRVDKKGNLVKVVAPKKILPGPAAPTGPAPSESTVAAGDAAGGGFELPTVDFSAIDALNPNTARLMDPASATTGAKLYGPGVAEAQAGLQYDSKILSLRDSALRNPLDTKQHVKDIGSWYGQVLASLKTAGERDSSLQKAAVDETVANTGAIAGAIGGEANAGSYLVGAAGAEAAGTLGALGLAQDQYNADLAPILQGEAASQKTREAASGSSKLADLKLQIAAALGERGQAQASNQFGVDQANNGVLDARAARQLQIIQANNAARQTNFQNKYGVETTRIGAQVSGAKEAADLAKTAVTTQGKIITKRNDARPTFSSPKGLKMQKDAYANYINWLANNATALKGMTPEQRTLAAGTYINRTYGWSPRINPDVANFIQTGLKSARF